jgi:tripartite-type tricarboxylate transporter receptor subunit TctC
LIAGARGSIHSAADLQARAASASGLTCAAPPGPMALACEQLKERSPGSVVVIPYVGISPAVAALLGGHVDAMFTTIEGVEPLVQAGSVRVIAASSRTAAEGVPLFSQVWPGLFVDGFTGVFVPARTPSDTVRRLNEALNQVVVQPAFRQFMQQTHQFIVGGSAEQFARRLAASYQRYGEVIRKANLAIDAPHPAISQHQ